MQWLTITAGKSTTKQTTERCINSVNSTAVAATHIKAKRSTVLPHVAGTHDVTWQGSTVVVAVSRLNVTLRALWTTKSWNNLLPVQLLCLTVLHSYHDHSQPSISAPLSCRAPRSSPTFWVFAAVTEIVKSVINVANLNPRLHQDPELCPPADADAPGASPSSPLWFRSHGVNHDFFMRRSFALLLMKLEM